MIIKLGPEGSVAKVGKQVYHQSTFDVVSLDTTGTGDRFNAGVSYGRLYSWDVSKNLQCANAMAAIAISRLGEDRYPTHDEVERFLQSEVVGGAK